jgi:hypothetical protein
MKKLLLAAIAFCIGAAATAQTNNTLRERLQLLKQLLDSAAMSKVDPRYIEVPQKPWRVVLRPKVNAVDVKYENSVENPLNKYSMDNMDWQLRFAPPTAHEMARDRRYLEDWH